VETFSGQGGTIFRVGWNLFQGQVEQFSHLGGNKFMVRWKENQGTQAIGGRIFMAKIRDLFRSGRKIRVLYME
jgi:hypothetical protein